MKNKVLKSRLRDQRIELVWSKYKERKAKNLLTSECLKVLFLSLKLFHRNRKKAKPCKSTGHASFKIQYERQVTSFLINFFLTELY